MAWVRIHDAKVRKFRRWRVVAMGVLTVSVPRVAGVYVVYLGNRIVYIGSSWNLAERFSRYPIRCVEGVWCTPWGGSVHLTVKYKQSRRFGDWLMDEARLIRRLKPMCNKQLTDANRKPSLW
jgi:hypothetical protein